MKRKYDPMIDPRLNHAKSWRDMLPVEPAEVDEPGWLKAAGAVALAALFLIIAFI